MGDHGAMEPTLAPARLLRAQVLARSRLAAREQAAAITAETLIPTDLVTIRAAADILGIDRPDLHRILAKHGIRKYHVSQCIVCISWTNLFSSYHKRSTPKPYRPAARGIPAKTKPKRVAA